MSDQANGSTSRLEDLAASTLETFRAQYEELCRTWNQLEAKAQGNVTICGIFIAGILGFFREMPQNTYWLLPIKLSTTCTLGLLGSCVYACVIVLRVREVTAAPTGESQVTMLNDLFNQDDFDDDRWRNFLVDQAKLWRDTNKEIEEINLTKSQWLNFAQRQLLYGMGFAIVSILLKVWI